MCNSVKFFGIPARQRSTKSDVNDWALNFLKHRYYYKSWLIKQHCICIAALLVYPPSIIVMPELTHPSLPHD